MAEVEVNGTTMFHTQAEGAGERPPIVVLHGGLGLDHTYVHRALSSFSDIARFVYLDHRGNGRSGRPPLDTITIAQLADDVDALRQALGYETVGLAGHSFGGFVALQYATTHPECLDRLLLLSTSPGGFEPTAEELAERGDRSWVTPEVEDALTTMFSAIPESDDDFAAAFPAIAPAYLRHADPSVLAAALEGSIFAVDAMRAGLEDLATWSVADRLGVISCPTFVGCGRHDLLTTPECARRLADAIPNSELAWFEESGHFPWLEEPAAFDAALRSFLTR